MNITLTHPTSLLRGSVALPVSKSESNRLLILEAISNGKVSPHNLSDARDTALLQAALKSESLHINIEDAGTAMRFLTAYYCATGQHKILTGSSRMQERPVEILVDALRDIGFQIHYLKSVGYPPLEIIPKDISTIKNEVYIAGDVSSQYISALMMIAPTLPEGLTIHFTTKIASKPYINLTLKLLSQAGIHHIWSTNSVQIPHQDFKEINLSTSADWSAASYWFSMALLAREAEIQIKDLSLDSDQGDRVIADWCVDLGLEVNLYGTAIYLSKSNSIYSVNLENSDPVFDFTDNPDLAQTVIVICAAKNIKATFSGLQSLRIKETDRIAALQYELAKFGVKLEECRDRVFCLVGHFAMSHQIIKTYNDHRMAMAFAPLALLGPVTIENAEVVAKSYPNFWKEMEHAGFMINSDIHL